MKIGGADIKVTRARTEAATARNTALRQASDLIKNESGVNDADVKIQWTGERGVTVSDVFLFFVEPPQSAPPEYRPARPGHTGTNPVTPPLSHKCMQLARQNLLRVKYRNLKFDKAMSK